MCKTAIGDAGNTQVGRYFSKCWKKCLFLLIAATLGGPFALAAYDFKEPKLTIQDAR